MKGATFLPFEQANTIALHAQIERLRGVQHERPRARRVRHSCRVVAVPEAVCLDVAGAPVAVIRCQS